MSHPVFSYFNLQKYLQLAQSEIDNLLICMNTCLVTLKNGEKIKVKAEQIKPIMEETRRERSKDIDIIDQGSSYKAVNQKSGSFHLLFPKSDHIKCTCEDYNRQLNFFEQKDVYCKHSYALLNHIGCNSLTNKEYQEMVEDTLLQAEYEYHCDRQQMLSYGWQDDSRYWGN